MAPLVLNDPVVSALKSRLDSDLTVQIAAINAAVTDGITIEDPKQVYDFVPNLELLDGGGYPSVGISDWPSRLEDDIGSSATSVHQLAIICYLVDQDLRSLAWKLRRYLRAVSSSALKDRQLPGGGGIGQAGAWGVRFVRSVPGRTLDVTEPEDVRTWMSYAAVVIEAKRDE